MDDFGISVVGMGRVGQIRCREIAEMQGCRLVSSHSRRAAERMPWKTILADPNVHAILVCTENAAHEHFIRDALLAGKHVSVEYPLVNSSRIAKELYQLAEQNNLVLHCEFIGLLSEAHQHRKEFLRNHFWTELSCAFQGGIYRWVEEEVLSGRFGQLAIGRLQAFRDLAGPLVLDRSSLAQTADGYILQVVLRAAGNRIIRLSEQRVHGLSRSTHWTIDGEGFPDRVSDNGSGLFEQDLRCFLGRVKGFPSYVSNGACMDVLELAERVNRSISR